MFRSVKQNKPATSSKLPGLSSEALASSSLTSRGYGIVKNSLRPEQLEAVRAFCTVQAAAPPVGPPHPRFAVFRESQSKIYLPKHLGLRTYGEPAEARLPPGRPLDAAAAAFSGSMREEQAGPVGAYLAAARDPLRRGGVINMGCGNGKTVMALHIVAQLRKRTMVIVHKEFLMNQWRERIEQFLPGASIGRVQGPALDADKDVVLVMLQTLASREFPPGALDGFGLVVVDECHHCSAEVFSRALHKINFEHSLGLSATVQRKDGLGRVFQWFLGEVVVVSGRGGQAATNAQKGGAVDPMFDTQARVLPFVCSDPKYREESFIGGVKINMARMVSNVCAYAPRTAFLVDALLAAAAERPTRTLVLSERRNHLVDIHRLLNARAPDVTVGYYVGGMREAQLKQAESCDVILGTFSMAAEGMDIPALDTLVLASPKSDIEQSVGRVLRVRPSERVCAPRIIDIVDGFSVFDAQARKRQRFYKQRGFVFVSQKPSPVPSA